MDILLQQLDHLDWMTEDIVIETQQTESDHYFVEGYIAYRVDGTRIGVTIFWSAEIQSMQYVRNEIGKPDILYNYLFKIEGSELEGIDMLFIEEEELEMWLGEFAKWIDWQSDITNTDHLPDPVSTEA